MADLSPVPELDLSGRFVCRTGAFITTSYPSGVVQVVPALPVVSAVEGLTVSVPVGWSAWREPDGRSFVVRFDAPLLTVNAAGGRSLADAGLTDTPPDLEG